MQFYRGRFIVLVGSVPPPSFTINTIRPNKKSQGMKLPTEVIKAYSFIRLNNKYKGKLAQISFSGEMTDETKNVIKELGESNH